MGQEIMKEKTTPNDDPNLERETPESVSSSGEALNAILGGEPQEKSMVDMLNEAPLAFPDEKKEEGGDKNKGVPDEKIKAPIKDESAAADQSQTNEGDKKPGESEQTGAEQKQEEAKADDTVFTLDENGKIRVGETEYVLADIQAAMQSHGTRTEWEKNLRRQSQVDALVRKLPEDARERFVNRVLQHVYSNDTPDTSTVEDKPIPITLVDEDDMEHQVNLQPGTDAYKAVKDHFSKLAKQEFEPAFSELANFKKREEEIAATEQSMQEQRISQGLEVLVNDLNLDIPGDGPIAKRIEEIYTSGEVTNPAYWDIHRLIQSVTDGPKMGLTAKEYYEKNWPQLTNPGAVRKQIIDEQKKIQKDTNPGESPNGSTKDAKMNEQEALQKLFLSTDQAVLENILSGG